MTKSCKTCRRLNQKLFLKGDRCSSPKCAFIKRPYAPGLQKKRRRSNLSEYGKELKEKQKLKRFYGLREKQFKKYIEAVLEKRGKVEDASLLLIDLLERRLDNVVFRLGLAKSRREARQLVSHSHFLVNEKPVNIPSFKVKKDDIVCLKETKKKKPVFQNFSSSLKNYQAPNWLKLDKSKLEGKVVGNPSAEEITSAVDIPSIFEFYSR